MYYWFLKKSFLSVMKQRKGVGRIQQMVSERKTFHLEVLLSDLYRTSWSTNDGMDFLRGNYIGLKKYRVKLESSMKAYKKLVSDPNTNKWMRKMCRKCWLVAVFFLLFLLFSFFLCTFFFPDTTSLHHIL